MNKCDQDPFSCLVPFSALLVLSRALNFKLSSNEEFYQNLLMKVILTLEKFLCQNRHLDYLP